MPLLSSQSGVSSWTLLSQHLSAIGRRTTYVLFIVALLWVGNGKAQEKANRINNLIKQLQSSDITERRSAASELGMIGGDAKDAVPLLIIKLSDEDTYVRYFAARALGLIRPATKGAVSALITALKDEVVGVRDNAAEALGFIGRDSGDAVPALIVALTDKEARVRTSAANTLGRIKPVDKETVIALTEALKDRDQGVCRAAGGALSSAAIEFFDAKSTQKLPELIVAYEAMKSHPDPLVSLNAPTVKRTIEYFESLWWVEVRNHAIKVISNYPYIILAIAAYLLLQLTWLLFFWLRPLSLLKVITSLSKTGEKYKIPKIEIPIPLKTALVFPLFHYRPRLLDAWVRHHLAISKDNFAKKQTVAQRKVYVTMPALIDEQMNEGISAAVLQPIFDKKKVTLLIAGEGGAGKTSLSCQMATWAMADESEQRLCKTHQMLPVLIEANLETRTDNKDSLVEAVRGGLRELIGEPEPIFEELLLHLLRKRRVLVIVDSVSEMDEATHKSVRPASADFPVAALVVTSRIDEPLGGASKSLLRPLRLQSNRLSEFMDGYLKQLGKRSLFDDPEYFAACGRLSEIVGDREITVLIAKMYAEQMIAAKETDAGSQAAARELPRNLPDLMLGYVKRLNDQVKAEKQHIRKVVNVTKVIAWECLKQTCRPTTAKRDDVLKALSKEPDAEPLLKYLENRLQLIQTTGPISDLIRFSLDPLAEYLAALYLVERCGKFEDVWQEFFENAEKQPGAPETIKGFLLAVRDCCLERGNEYDVPEWVNDKLAQLAALNPELVNAAQHKQRINLWITNLKSADARDQITAARTLGGFGPGAKDAVPALVDAIKDQNKGVRSSAVVALGRIGPKAKEAVPSLIAVLQNWEANVCSFAAEALGKIGPEAKDAVSSLIAALQDQEIQLRYHAAYALGKIGPEAKTAIPSLIAALQDREKNDRSSLSSAAYALGGIGPDAKDALPELTALLKHQEEVVRRSAVDAIGKFGPEAKEAVPSLIALFSDDGLVSAAAGALGKIGPEAKEAVPSLIKLLSEDYENVRHAAAKALGKIGPEAKEAVPALTVALNDQNEMVRQTTAEALKMIETSAAIIESQPS